MLSERQLLILQAIVDDYIRSAEPVGSRSISKRGNVSFSAATIRNEMADLEELGYIEKPHSSAGRIPSQKGYRYYVDHLLLPHRLTNEELMKLRAIYENRMLELEQVIQQSAKILSQITSYISVALAPELLDTKLQHIQIIPLSTKKAVIILVTDTGHVENHSISLPENMNSGDIEKVVNILNERLKGVELHRLRTVLSKEVAKVMRDHVDNYEKILQVISDALKHDQADKPEKIFYGGKANLLSQPEFRDVEKARMLYSYLEESPLVQQLFRSDGSGIHVKIGHENKLEAFENCSIITATYSIGGKCMGTIGILGPTRMEYQRVISIIDYLSKHLTKTLTALYQSE